MKKYKIITPQNVEIEYQLSGVGSRTAAFFIDVMIQTVVLALLAVLGYMFVQYTDILEKPRLLSWFMGISILIVFIINYGYFVVFEQIMNGRTPGKKLFGLRVIRQNGLPVSLYHSLIRNLFLLLDLSGIGVILILFTRHCRRIGDFASSTIVVVEKKAELYLIDLEKLQDQSINDKNTVLTAEEKRLLKEYMQRRFEIGEKVKELEIQMGEYFSKKLERSLEVKEYRAFLEQLI